MLDARYPSSRPAARPFSALSASREALKRFVGRATVLGRRPSSTRGADDPEALTIEQATCPWEGCYALESYTKPLCADRSSLDTGFTTMTSSWDADTGLLTFWSMNAVPDDDNLLRGFILGLEREDGGLVDLVATMFPKEHCTITCGFVLESPLRWLSLPVGERDQVQVVDKGLVVELHRLDPTGWRFAIESIRRTGEREPPFQLATLNLETDSPRPPWNSLGVEFSSMDERGITQTSLRLERLAAGSESERRGEPARFG